MTSIIYQFEPDELPEDHALAGWTPRFEIQADVSRYVPARTQGDPDSCYPGEGGEVEITSVQALPGPNGAQHPLVADAISQAFHEIINSNEKLRDEIEDLLRQEAAGDPGYDADVLYDQWKDEGGRLRAL